MLLILVHILIVVLVITAGDVVHPLFMVQVPVDGQHDALLERGLRVPAQIVLDLGGVDAVTAVMAQTVSNVLDQVLADALVLQTVVELVDDGLDDEDVGRSLWPPTLYTSPILPPLATMSMALQ